MSGGFPQTPMLGARSKTVNRMLGRRFESATACGAMQCPRCGPAEGAKEWCGIALRFAVC